MPLMTSGFCELEHSKFLNSQDYIEGERDSDSKNKKMSEKEDSDPIPPLQKRKSQK